MEIRRTANAGILLALDDAKILIDGVCREVYPYPATPADIARELCPDAMLFTHCHPDHFDPVLAGRLNSPIFAPAQVAEQVSCPICTEEELMVGKVRVSGVTTRHMGHYGKTTQHRSYVIRGEKTLWFLGDAAPTELKKLAAFPKPDLLLVPYPYISTPAAIKMVQGLLPCKIILLHMPLSKNDSEGIWQNAAEGIAQLKPYLYIPEMGETLNF